jgi:carotenoid cleavage dioxygenase-like enzyme
VNAANTHLLPVDGKLWALWEAGSPTAINPRTLATEGFVTLREDLAGMPFLAHPKVEPDGRIWNLGVLGKHGVIWRLSASGALEEATTLELPRASYLHDFTATDRELVIILQPWVRERQTSPFADGMAWRPELGTQVLVIDKADLSRRRTYELPPFFFFHLGDAWRESDGTIRFDGCTSADAGFVERDIARMTKGGAARAEPPSMTLFALHPDGRASMQRLAATAEFPRTDGRRAGLKRRFTWHVSEGNGQPLARGVAVTDLQTGRTDGFDLGDGHVVEEAVFVPRPGGSTEGDGWLVGSSINLKARATELRVYDARRVSAGPLCTWRADVALPAGFHGVFVPA